MFKAWLAPLFAIVIFCALLFLPVTPYHWLLWVAGVLSIIAVGLIIWRCVLNKRLKSAEPIQSAGSIGLEKKELLDIKRKIYLLDKSILILEWSIFILLVTLRFLNGQLLTHLTLK